MKCIITGGDLQTAHGVAHGDLFAVGANVYVFNAVINKGTGETIWLRHNERAWRNLVTIPEGEDFWERRGVIVFTSAVCVFSPEALDYVNKWR